MRDTSDKYLRAKIFLAKIMGVAVLIVSMQFSQNGFGFKEEEIGYIGWVLAIAVTIAQFVFNSRVKNLNWTITSLGIMAYVYSIWTNLLGFYNYQGRTLTFETLLDFNAILPIFASVFLDVFPETILSWSFNSAGEGDLIGNILAVGNDPDNIFSRRNGNNNGGNAPRQSVPSSLPRQQTPQYENRRPQSTGTPPPIRETPISGEKHPSYHTMRIPSDLLPSEES